MSNGTDSPVTGPIETIARGPRQRSLVALGAAAVGTVLAVVGFYSGIIAALDGRGNGAEIWLVVMFVGLLFDVVALVLAILSLVQRRSKVVSAAAIVVALVPAIWLAVLVVALRP